MKPVVAIIGRPNVGKSTLFNRLAGRNKAIVIDEPGATRDRHNADCTWDDKSFLLIDTGGFVPAATETILMQMREQAHQAMEEADVIIFLMDGRSGLTHEDIEIAEILRRLEKPVFFVINKIDSLKQENLAYEFYRLGMEKIYTISALHGLGMGELMDDVSGHFPPALTDREEEDRIKIAVIGKPNVGKSSLVNKILGYERTIVNPMPGTTRDAIDTPFTLNDREYLLIDTAGIRRKSRVYPGLEKFSIIQAVKAVSRCDVALIVIDAKEGVTDQDVKIAGLAFERGVVCVFVVNKWDRVEKDRDTAGKYVKEIRDKAKFLEFAPVIFVSALTGQRVRKLFDIVNTAYCQYSKRVNTPELNRKVREFLSLNPPPRYQNRANSVSYVTQVSVKPPTFVFFFREPKAIHFSYERFLVNQIRETFGFADVPLRIIFRKKTSSLIC
ncbi:MAG: ribosome biogenesis GTPase Der [Syntrophaceae bacterium CG2_30_49_12]|nr:MAG: ribosome biogenesis GTPase Der [Syntrophaceae bacterium CG2_30_49_12]